MREFGYRVIDMLVEDFAGLADSRVTSKADRGTLEAKLKKPFPETGRSIDSVLEQVRRDVFAYTMRVNHPRFFAFVPGPGNYAGTMADVLAAGMNFFQGT